jgi:hypothetical protein
MSRVGVLIKRGLDWMIGFINTLFTHSTRDYTQHSATAILHTFQFTVAHALVFSVFNSRILATTLQPSYCRFKSHMKSSFPASSLLPVILQLPIPKIGLISFPHLPGSHPGRLASRSSTLQFRLLISTAEHYLLITLHG